MKRNKSLKAIAYALIAVFVCDANTHAAPQAVISVQKPPEIKGGTNQEAIVVYPVPDDSMLINPGKGWVQYYGVDDKYTGAYIGTGYTRASWSAMEPREGEFDWRPIDQFIAGFAKYGKKVGFGVMSVSTGLGQYVTPKWVFDAGAKPMEVPDTSSPTGKQIIPESWEDPVFLQKMKAFIAAFGKHCDGNPNIAFLDLRNYGNWGEGHIGMLGNSPKLGMTPPESLQNNYYLPYLNAFPNTQLIAVWGSPMYDKVYDWAVTQGMGIRRDGILSEWSKSGSECLRAYGHAPGIFEYCDSYETTKKKGYWSTDRLMEYVKAGKPSYMQWDPKIFEENREFCLKLGNKMGYHFVLREVTVPKTFTANVPFRIVMKWLNDGVACLYEPCSLAVALLDSADNVLQRQWLVGSNPKNWNPDELKTEELNATFPSVPREYRKLAIGLFLSKDDPKPAYKLGIKGRTANGWYVLTEK